jgi:Mg2+ and Co2+ transporter CorA
MNVHVPGQGTMTGFWLVVGVMAVLLGGMVTAFKHGGWL